jgi:hypothetical protein
VRALRLAPILLIAAACEYRGDEPFRTGGKSPPNFTGIASAQPYSAYAVLVSWSAANDDTTDAAAIDYAVWTATAPGAEDLAGAPAVSVQAALRALAGGLLPGERRYFVVHATDQDGMRERNGAELDATTFAPAPPLRTLTSDVQPILARSCAALGRCHGPVSAGTGMEQGMDFSTADSAAAALLGNVPARTNPALGRLRVKAGDSGNSFLMDKLLDVLGPDDGHAMPYDNSLTAIDDNQIRLIAEWIDQGAMR